MRTYDTLFLLFLSIGIVRKRENYGKEFTTWNHICYCWFNALGDVRKCGPVCLHEQIDLTIMAGRR